METIQYLKERFDKTLKYAHLKDNELIFNNIISCYSEPHRHYHTIEHLRDCFELVDKCNHVIYSASFILEVSLWLHDIVYIPNKQDNEKQSAKYTSLFKNILTSQESFLIKKFILLTKNHISTDIDFKNWIYGKEQLELFLDIDNSILASSKLKYKQYKNNIRKEYSFASDKDFYTGRLKFLKQQLEKANIFFVLNDFEKQARINMLNEYVELSKE